MVMRTNLHRNESSVRIILAEQKVVAKYRRRAESLLHRIVAETKVVAQNPCRSETHCLEGS